MKIIVDTNNGTVIYNNKVIPVDLLGAISLAPVGSTVEVVGRYDCFVELFVVIANEQREKIQS
jgi:hypothetical protein